MNIRTKATAGTQEKGDILLSVAPCAQGIHIALTSSTGSKFKAQVLRTIEATLAQHGVAAAEVAAEDRGAFDFVIRARLETALRRAAESEAVS